MNESGLEQWDETAARAAIEAIAFDAYTHFDAKQFWPAHPLDEWAREGDTTLYWGATGCMWALDYLASEGAVARERDFAPFLSELIARNRAAVAAMAPLARLDPKQASLLIGDIGPLLLAMRLEPTAQAADELHTRISANLPLPPAELMWGVAGTMLACVFLDGWTRESRWRALYSSLAEKLLGDLEETDSGPLWTQSLYGRTFRFLGLVHGFAGNVVALLRGWDWLNEPQRAKTGDVLARTLTANAVRSEGGANWRADALGPMDAKLVQLCHGAPGIIVACADARVMTPQLRALLLEGGECVWRAGPLSKGSNLCHGTGGNGYAFLKLFALGDALWLARARIFAMHAIGQWRAAQAQYGRGRYSLWTGDLGLAIFLWDCITARPRFPTVDLF